MGEHQAMARTIHRLQCVRVFAHVEFEHVIAKMLPVAGRLPQFGIVDIRRDDFVESTLSIFGFNEVDECVVDVCAVWLKETRARRQFVEEKQLLILTDFAVVALRCFRLLFLPFFQLLVTGK